MSLSFSPKVLVLSRNYPNPVTPILGLWVEGLVRLYRHVAEVWSDREKQRFGASVEPMLQWAKVKTIESESQFVPCKAGVLTGVVYANGDVSICEQHFPLGNLRKNSFFEIWDSEEAQKLRAQIKAKECYCTNEVFLWSSIVFQPVQLTRAAIGSKQMQRKSNAVPVGKV